MLRKTFILKNICNIMLKKVMVVDDEQDIRDTVRILLEKEGYEVITAISGNDCLDKINSGAKPDLILMDIMMPGIPTKEVVKRLENFKISYLSVVRITEAEKEDLLKKKNIVDFIQKPFKIKDLLDKVKKIIG